MNDSTKLKLGIALGIIGAAFTAGYIASKNDNVKEKSRDIINKVKEKNNTRMIEVKRAKVNKHLANTWDKLKEVENEKITPESGDFNTFGGDSTPSVWSQGPSSWGEENSVWNNWDDVVDFPSDTTEQELENKVTNEDVKDGSEFGEAVKEIKNRRKTKKELKDVDNKEDK